jgi:hypothetical protein
LCYLWANQFTLNSQAENIMNNEENKNLTHIYDSQSNDHLSSPRLSWRKPIITRIELKRTMLGQGSITDGEVPSEGIDLMDFDK